MKIDEIASKVAENASYQNISYGNDEISLTVAFNQNKWELIIVVNDSFPYSLPQIRLQNPTSHGHLEHVCWRGVVCYSEDEGISIDTTRPTKVFDAAISQAVKVLEKAKTAGVEGLLNEFEGYWNKIPNSLSGVNYLPPDLSRADIQSKVDLKTNRVSFAGYGDDLEDSYGYHHAGIKSDEKNISFYLPLTKAVLPPLPLSNIDEGFIRSCISKAKQSHLSKIKSFIVRKGCPQKLMLLISQPRPEGGVSQFGLYIIRAKSLFIKSSNTAVGEIRPIRIQRHTREHLTQRRGGATNIDDKKVAIIGCGSVGSRIAEFLLMSGVTKLHLVDPDTFSVDNLYRHILNSHWIGYSKVKALKAQLQQRFPYTKITTSTNPIYSFSDQLIKYDSICLAIGNPTLERVFNEEHYNSMASGKPKLITTWLEAFGVAGHSFVQDGRSVGCFNCLYHTEKTPKLVASINFVKAGQTISKNLTGCGGAFIPYGALDSARTAEIASRQIVDSLKGARKNMVKYQHWYAEELPNEAMGTQLTAAYTCAKENELSSSVVELLDQGCPICER